MPHGIGSPPPSSAAHSDRHCACVTCIPPTPILSQACMLCPLQLHPCIPPCKPARHTVTPYPDTRPIAALPSSYSALHLHTCIRPYGRSTAPSAQPPPQRHTTPGAASLCCVPASAGGRHTRGAASYRSRLLNSCHSLKPTTTPAPCNSSSICRPPEACASALTA